MMPHPNVENGPPSEGQGQGPSGSGHHLDDATSEHISPPKDQIQLKWTSHQPTIFNIFQDLYNSEQLVDVTLAAEGKYLRAHKIILSACSPYFQELLSLDCSTKHPILFMSPGVKFDELTAILNYMYKGETQIPQENLSSLLRLAEALQIRGLAETKKSSPVPIPAPVPVPQPQPQHQQNWPTHPTICTGISVKTGIGIKHKTTGSSIQKLNQPLIVTNPNTSSFPSNPLDISTTNSAKRFRVDPIILIENQNPLQNVEETTILPTTAYDEAPIYSLSGVEGQGNPEVEDPIQAHPTHQIFEMEDIQIIEDHEMKVEDESNSCSRSQSDFQIPSTSSSYQGQLDRDIEDDSGDGGLETNPDDGGRHKNMNINETWSEEDKVVYQCPSCPKSYALKSSLSRHMLNHTASFICPVCSLQFPNPDKFRYHLRMKHPRYNFGRISSTTTAPTNRT